MARHAHDRCGLLDGIREPTFESIQRLDQDADARVGSEVSARGQALGGACDLLGLDRPGEMRVSLVHRAGQNLGAQSMRTTCEVRQSLHRARASRRVGRSRVFVDLQEAHRGRFQAELAQFGTEPCVVGVLLAGCDRNFDTVVTHRRKLGEDGQVTRFDEGRPEQQADALLHFWPPSVLRLLK